MYISICTCSYTKLQNVLFIMVIQISPLYSKSLLVAILSLERDIPKELAIEVPSSISTSMENAERVDSSSSIHNATLVSSSSTVILVSLNWKIGTGQIKSTVINYMYQNHTQKQCKRLFLKILAHVYRAV